MQILKILLALILLAAVLNAANAAMDESYGTVINVVDGDTFDISVEKADPRITSSVERIRLADVDSPEIGTQSGPAARDFTYAVLMNKKVFLDIDDLSGSGRDKYGRLVCIAYLTGAYGQPLSTPSFNQLLIDSGHASLNDFTDNEFSLEEGPLPKEVPYSQPGDNLSDQLENLKDNLMGQFRDFLAAELDKRSNEAVDWLRGQSLG